MNTDEAAPPLGAQSKPAAAGFFVTGVTPDDQTCLAAAMLIALLAHSGENVAAMVPVETSVDDPCEPGSHGALVRWAAAHLDDPRLVTPFAFEQGRPAMHAADVSGRLLHGAAFDRAREKLCEGRTALVVSDAVGTRQPFYQERMVSAWRRGTLRVAELTAAFTLLAEDTALRVIVLGGQNRDNSNWN